MSTEGMSTEGSGAGSTVDLDEALRIVKSFPDQIEMLMSENAQLRTDLEAARAEIAEARRQLFKWPVTYGNASEFTLAAMVVEAQHEMAQRTLALNETRAEIERLHTEGAEVSDMYIARSAELRTARADLAQARARIAELEKIERGLNAENSRLLTSNADMRAVVEAAQKFFGRSGERWFDRADCALLQRTVSVGLGNNTCTCGGHELSRSLKTLDAARETDG